MASIKAENLSHIYSAGTPFEKVALDSISVDIPQGLMIGLLGHTGSGKSTFIQHLNALMAPTSGRVLIDGQDINESKKTRYDVKFQVGLVFQYPEYQLFEETVYADIAFGPKNMGLEGDELDKNVREAAAFAGVEDDLFEKSPLELSGGQKRRIAIAGVIAMKPSVLILDEPTAGLDPGGCDSLLDNLVKYKNATGSTVIVVTHNMDSIAAIADRLIVLSEGKLAMEGTPDEIFSDAKKLKELSLDVPKATEIAMKLGIKEAVYTHEQLIAAIRGMKNA